MRALRPPLDIALEGVVVADAEATLRPRPPAEAEALPGVRRADADAPVGVALTDPAMLPGGPRPTPTPCEADELEPAAPAAVPMGSGAGAWAIDRRKAAWDFSSLSNASKEDSRSPHNHRGSAGA